ncbi:MAG: spore coat U domain-containing protein [Casimicrobiaceae bacterium]
MNVKLISAAALAAFGLAASIAQAATVTNTMPVKITIQNACNVTTTAPTTLDFGTAGPLVANVDNSSTITVTCTNLAPYTVGLDAGLNGGGVINARKMISGAATVGYQLYSDAARTLVWGFVTPVAGSGTAIAGTGNGTAQALTVYGRVPPQTTPAANVYTDTVAVTVTY